jgi:ankyrin repeat protein
VARTDFRIDEKDAHKCIAITCVRYLALCAACTTLAKRLPDIESWTSEHFGDYTQYLDERPLAIYALCYLKHHIDCCHLGANALDITSRFTYELTQNPAVYLLESWVSSHLNTNLLNDEQGSAAEGFRDKVLHSAVRKRLLIAAEVLLAVGTDINAKDKEGRTPLSCAALNGNEAVVRLLLEKGAELEAKDHYDQTPLSYAAENGHEAIIKLLLKKGAELETKDYYDRTPLSYATLNRHEAVVKLLLEKGAGLETKDHSDRTPLSYAALNGHEAVVKLLLEKGAGLETKDHSGRTPLSCAALNGHEAVVKLLLEKGAELETKDHYDQTPLLYAAENGYKAIVQLLLKKGAKKSQ